MSEQISDDRCVTFRPRSEPSVTTNVRTLLDQSASDDLLPMAHEGLERWGVSAAVRDRFLTIIEQRCLLGVNGASWQTECVARLEARGLTRDAALREMLRHYIEGMMANEPVHTWELPRA